MDSRPRPVVRSAQKGDRAFLAVFLTLYSFVFLLTLRDYGLTWDCWELYFGDKNLYFLTSFETDYLRYSHDNIEIYHHPDHPDFFEAASKTFPLERSQEIWPLGPTTSSVTKHLFFVWLGLLDPIDAHHSVLLLYVILLFGAVYLFALSNFDRCSAIVAVSCLAVHPRFLAHAHNNLKDVPSAVLFSLTLILICTGVNKNSAKLIVISGLIWGAALAAKANALFIPLILLPWLTHVTIQRRSERKSWHNRLTWSLVAVPFVAVLTFLALWPDLLRHVPEDLLQHFDYLRLRGWGGTAEWNFAPLGKLFTTTPLPMLFLMAVGAVSIPLRRFVRQASRTSLLLLLLWLVVPLLRVSVPYSHDFDGIRHWLEFVPAACLLAGLGGSQIIDWLERVWSRSQRHELVSSVPARCAALTLMLLLALGPVTAWNVSNHPYQLVFFNSLVGGLGGAQERRLPDSTDYWGSSYRQGIVWINRHAEAGSLLVVPVAGQIVEFVKDIWLRDDLSFLNLHLLSSEEDERRAVEFPGPVYAMYVTRTGFYPKMLIPYDSSFKPVHTKEVDGGVILKILKLR